MAKFLVSVCRTSTSVKDFEVDVPDEQVEGKDFDRVLEIAKAAAVEQATNEVFSGQDSEYTVENIDTI